MGVSFRYQDENNYYRFEMNSQESVRRLKKVVGGVVRILWLSPGGEKSLGYEPGIVYTVRVLLQGVCECLAVFYIYVYFATYLVFVCVAVLLLIWFLYVWLFCCLFGFCMCGCF